MPAPILVAGLDGRSLLLEAPVLQRSGHPLDEKASGKALVNALLHEAAGLVVLGTRLPDLSLVETIRRIRTSALTRQVSILVLVPAGDPADIEGKAVEAGANAVLRRPLERARLEAWVAKLLIVPRRVETRIAVHGQVVGTPRDRGATHFLGLSRNLSVHGMLLASPLRLEGCPDVDLELNIPASAAGFKLLGRIVREAPEVGWPYLGYGVEFLFTPPETMDEILSLVSSQVDVPGAARAGIHSTVRRENWIYEVLQPVRHGPTWHVEIRRAPRDIWRPGVGGPFYVVEGNSPDEAIRQARLFLERHG